MYCGDETGAFIGDVGSHTARFGYGGEDCPKVVVPSAAYARRSRDEQCRGDAEGPHRTSSRGGTKFSAPVSLMRVPPDDCFSVGDEGDEGVGFVPIYRSLNSNATTCAKECCADDGLIQDNDAWASLWEYSFGALCVRGRGKHTTGHANCPSQPEPELQPVETDGPIDHPLLAVDSTGRNIPSRGQEKQRALMLEALFESLSAPAAYIAPSPMLSSFAYGRQTALVVDVGHSSSRVTPLVDGYCLNHGSVSSGRGGRWLGDVQRGVLEGAWDVNGSTAKKWNGWCGRGKASPPPCQDEGVIPRYLLHPDVLEKCGTDRLDVLKRSPFHSVAVQDVMYEMMTSPHILPMMSSGEGSAPFCGYGSNGDGREESMGGQDAMEIDNNKDEGKDEEGLHFMLPDGTRVDLSRSRAGKDLCRLPELLFSETLPSFIQPSTVGNNSHSDSMLPLHHLIHTSLTEILDVDMRKELSSNIILTGGASLFPSLDKRLSAKLGEVLPSSYKYKVIASKNSVETRFGAWIGGSILSSLGSFQQLWLSKREYDECGALLALQRFKN